MPVSPDPARGPVAVLRQLVVDFFRNAFGSDATVAYTAEYAWLANQVAHILLGFFLGVVWILGVQRWWPELDAWRPWSYAAIFLVPFLKDVVDFLLDTLWRGGRPFEVNKRELILDWVTDDIYWGIGLVAAIAAIGVDGDAILFRALTIGVGLALAVYLAFGVWVPRKRMFDFSRMPFNFVRLVKYPDPAAFLPKASIDALVEFQTVAADPAGRKDPPHYVLTGGRPIQRSALAVSMGCEYISHGRGVYMISAVKVLEDPERMRKHCRMAKAFKAEVRCLIIDDLNVSLPIPQAAAAAPAKAKRAQYAKTDESPDTRQADKLLHFVEVFDELRTTFPNVTTVWVASANVTVPADRDRLELWKQFIHELAGAKALTTVEMTEPPSERSDR